MSNIIGNTTYDPAAFPIDVSTSSCVDPSTLLPQTIANPVSGQPLLWLNFDARAYAGTFQIQITDGNENLGWALYYAEPPFTYPTLNATTGEYISGDCDNLTFWMCGTASSSNWNTIVMPQFRVAGAFYIAIWDQAADGNMTVGAFKTRNGCGGDPTFGMVELGDQRVLCNGDGTYTVEQEVWGINATLVASDPAALSSPSAQVCLTGPSGVTHDTLRISYNHGTAFNFDIDALTTGVTSPCVVPTNAGDLFFHDIAGASPADSDNDGICDSEDLCTNNTATNYTAVPSAACLFTWYLDADGDGLGQSGSSQSATSQPSGYVLSNTDLCDNNTACNYNANTTTNAACTYATTWYPDTDGDGLGAGTSTSSCTQPSGYVSNSTDLCDNNTACNYNAASVTNAACVYPATWYADADGDGLGDSGDTQSACSQPSGYVADNTDLCDDNTACNYDAAAVTNAACTFASTWYADEDGDGLGDSGDSQSSCTQPSGYVANSTDMCDDTTACNYDANTTTNAACVYPATWYADADGDGLGDSGDTQLACTQPSSYVVNSTDLCDDNTACNYNANTTTNAACTYATTWVPDTDGDGLGAGTSTSSCAQPSGYVS
ncbi:MAG: hypothetical protein RJA19_852, partial [Bacteroidota bacterium]